MASKHAEVQSCQFPAVGKGPVGDKTRPLSVRVELQRPELLRQLLVKENGNTLLIAGVKAAWALVLRTYTGLDQVCFGVSEVGGALADSGTGEAGHRESIAAHVVSDEVSLEEIARPVEEDEVEHERFQYNTAVLFRFAGQGTTPSGSAKAAAVSMGESVSSIAYARYRGWSLTGLQSASSGCLSRC